MRRTFTIAVERDSESGWFVGEVLELPGCFTQAPDLAELKGNMIDAIRLCLRDEKLQEPLPEFVETYQVEVVA